MEGEASIVRRPAPRYEDEDTGPTTERELKGWYSYGLAAEVYAVCGVGSFLPVTLEQLARERGVLRSDGVTSCIAPKSSQPATAHGSGSQLVSTMFRRALVLRDQTQCVIHPFGREVSTASFAMYTFSVAVLVQALVLISFSSVADHGTWRKKLLLTFGFVGSLSCMLFIFVTPSIYLMASVLVIIGVACLGSSFVLLNSFLPLLAWNHPSVAAPPTSKNYSSPVALGGVSAEEDFDALYGKASQTKRNIPEDSSSPALDLSTKISSKGVGIGYAAAVLVQVLSILLLVGLSKLSFSSATVPLRLVLFLVGVWWAAFTIPCALWLRDRPGPPLKTTNPNSGRISRIFTYVFFAWGSVWKTIKVAAKLRQTVIFLVAWFLLSDAIATVSGTAILFARTELKMGTVPIAILSITATSSGIAGAFIWPIISRRYELRTNRTIIACMVLMEIIPVYGLMGYLPFVKAWGFGGLQQAWEIYPLGFVHGFVMGGLSSYCRSFYGLLIPPGSEAAFYALYAITDKGSSAVGPTMVGLIVDATGTIRPAFGFLAILIALPIPLILMIDAEKGRADAVRMAETLGTIGSARDGFGNTANGDSEDREGLLSAQ